MIERRSARTPVRRPADAGALPHGRVDWRRRVMHVLVVAAGWCLFVWFWSLVIGQPYDVRELRLLIAGCVVVVPVVTLGWVLHNVGIYRRKGPRRSVPGASPSYRVDFNGRRIVADWQLLDRVRHAEIGVAGELKFYRFARAVGEGQTTLADPPRSGGRSVRTTRPIELNE